MHTQHSTPMTTPAHAQREMYRDLGGFYVYQFRRSGDMPEWNDLTPYQQRRFLSAFLIGASSIDLAKVMKEQG
jgi:hypothetical protein